MSKVRSYECLSCGLCASTKLLIYRTVLHLKCNRKYDGDGAENHHDDEIKSYLTDVVGRARQLVRDGHHEHCQTQQNRYAFTKH